ncbi:MAG: histidine kinase [Ancalomicrobiaceae bacterium]|nr:histidine kinase [Ancalomicrobiaceae bacterium]
MLKKIYYIYAIYSAIIIAVGVLVRFGLGRDVFLAVVQTVLFDAPFIAILFFLAFVIKNSDITVSLTTTVAIIVGSAALGIFYSLVFIKPLLLPMLTTILHAVEIPLYPAASVALYYGMIALIWTMTFVWMTNIQRSSQNEIAAINARNDSEKRTILVELRRLREQMDPHLVFNSLNTAIADAREDPQQAVAMLQALSTFLRYSLDMGDQEFASVAAEVDTIDSYLRVQRMRFGRSLDANIELAPEAGHHLVPTLLFQTLVENALKHGLPDASGVLRVGVNISAEGDSLTIEVRNSGRLGPAERSERGANIGLSNMRSRLQLHYGERATFQLNQVDDFVVAVVHLTGEPQ